MKVRLNTIMAGPHGCWHPGEVVDLPKATAELLLKQGAARKPGEALESAAVKPPETAMQPAAEARG